MTIKKYSTNTDFDMVVVLEEGCVNVCTNFKAIHEMLSRHFIQYHRYEPHGDLKGK